MQYFPTICQEIVFTFNERFYFIYFPDIEFLGSNFDVWGGWDFDLDVLLPCC